MVTWNVIIRDCDIVCYFELVTGWHFLAFATKWFAENHWKSSSNVPWRGVNAPYFDAEIKERELMSRRLNKYIASFHYFDKSLIVLSVTTGSVSIASFATVIEAPVGIVWVSFSLAFLISTWIIKKLFKKTRNKKKKHNKIFILARSKLNSIESKISEVLINNEVSLHDFMTIISEEKKYRELKESIRMMNTQRTDSAKIKLIEEDKKYLLMELLNSKKLLITV